MCPQRAILEDLTSAAVPGRHLVDSLPWLNYLPSALAPWKKEAARIFNRQNELFGGHMMDVKRQTAAGQDAHCFVKYLLDGQKDSQITDQEIAFLAGVMVGAQYMHARVERCKVLSRAACCFTSMAPGRTRRPTRLRPSS